jgi:TonB family protein
MGGTISPLAINFNYSILKRRFIMMSKSKTGKAGMLKYLFVIPVILMLLFLLNIDKSDGFNGRSGLNLLPDTPDNNATITIYGTRDIKKNEHKTDITTYYPDSVVYSVVEKMPEFKGGNDALNKYILDNIIYPEEARKKGIEGTVYVSFIVNQKGKVTKVKLSKGVDLLLDAEAIRVIKSMPDWKPGRNKGEPVSVSYTVPIKFRLEKEKK